MPASRDTMLHKKLTLSNTAAANRLIIIPFSSALTLINHAIVAACGENVLPLPINAKKQ